MRFGAGRGAGVSTGGCSGFSASASGIESLFRLLPLGFGFAGVFALLTPFGWSAVVLVVVLFAVEGVVVLLLLLVVVVVVFVLFAADDDDAS